MTSTKFWLMGGGAAAWSAHSWICHCVPYNSTFYLLTYLLVWRPRPTLTKIQCYIRQTTSTMMTAAAVDNITDRHGLSCSFNCSQLTAENPELEEGFSSHRSRPYRAAGQSVGWRRLDVRGICLSGRVALDLTTSNLAGARPRRI